MIRYRYVKIIMIMLKIIHRKEDKSKYNSKYKITNNRRKNIMRKLIIVVVLIISLIGIQGCSPKSQENKSSEKTDASGTGSNSASEVLRIGTMPNNIGAPIYYAFENGLYAEAGLNVEVILFPTGAPINEALSAEQIDIAGSGLASVYGLASGDCSWLGDIDVTVGGMGIYVRPDSPVLQNKGLIEGKPDMYGSAETIKGLTILGPLGTSAQFNAITWAQNFGLTGDDFTMLHMEFGPSLQAFKSGEADAIATSPPFVYQAEELGYVNAGSLMDAAGIQMMNGILARTKVVESRREDVKKFLEVTYSVVDKFYDDDQLVFDYSLDFYNRNGKEYTEDMMWKEIHDRDFYGKVEFSKANYAFGSTMVGMGDFYVKDGKIEASLAANIPASMEPTFLEEIYGIDIHVYGE